MADNNNNDSYQLEITNHSGDEVETDCFICASSPEGEPTIQPCSCKKSRVHRSCLNEWRVTSESNNVRCPTCQTLYVFESLQVPLPILQRQETRLKLQILLILIKAISIAVAGISIFAGLTYWLDKDGRLPGVLRLSPKNGYLVWGMLFFFIIVNLYGFYWGIRYGGLSGYCGGPTCQPCGDLGCGGGGDCAFYCCIVMLVVTISIGFVWGLYYCSRSIYMQIDRHYQLLPPARVVDLSQAIDKTPVKCA